MKHSPKIELSRLANDSATEVSSMLLELEGSEEISSNRRWPMRFIPAATKTAPPRWPNRFIAADVKSAPVRR